MKGDGVTEDLSLPAKFWYSAFYDLLADAAFQHQQAKQTSDSYTTNRFARASVLASALSVECAANCLISSLGVNKSLFDELDKLPPIAKIEVYCRLRGIETFDRGRSAVQRVSELGKARNDFVHPKSALIKASVEQLREAGENVEFPLSLEGERWPLLKITKRSMFWSHESSLAALGAVANFFTYLFVDLLKASQEEIDHMLPSRLEVGELIILAVFDEIRAELVAIGEYGVDFSFFGLSGVAESKSTETASSEPES